jgi:SAM-dependent methyltransferase
VTNHYSESYFNARHAVLEGDYFEARGDLCLAFYFQGRAPQEPVFEYGCGAGQNLAKFPGGMGFDVCAEAVRAAGGRGLNVSNSIDEPRAHAWRIILCRHVLEHLEDPLGTLQMLRDMLSRDGELILVVPRERHGDPPRKVDVDQHLYAWNFRTLQNLCQRAGLEPRRSYIRWMRGDHKLISVRRCFGGSVYARAVQAVGWLSRSGELVVHARRAQR